MLIMIIIALEIKTFFPNIQGTRCQIGLEVDSLETEVPVKPFEFRQSWYDKLHSAVYVPSPNRLIKGKICLSIKILKTQCLHEEERKSHLCQYAYFDRPFLLFTGIEIFIPYPHYGKCDILKPVSPVSNKISF